MEVKKRTAQAQVATSPSIVHAKCLDVKVAEDASGIFTYTRFEVIEAIKGPGKKQLTLRLLGGRIGNVEVDSALSRRFQPGSEYLMILGSENSDGYPTIVPTGVYVVATEPQSKRKVAVPGPEGLTVYNSQTGKAYRHSLDWVFLDDLIYSMKKAM